MLVDSESDAMQHQPITPSSAQFTRRFQQMLAATEAAYQASVLWDMPICSYRDFCLWALEPENPYRATFVQITGIRQLARLTTTLLDGLTQDEHDWQHVLAASMTMNAWQIHEVVSDNLAIHLAHTPEQSHSSMTGRHRLLSVFNTLVIEQLTGSARSASELGALVRPLSQTVSLFEHSLVPQCHHLLASAYVHEHDSCTLNELEYAAWVPLAANVTACAAVVRAIGMVELEDLMRDSVVRRYQGVNKLLIQSRLTLPELLDTSTHTILVIPTLTYYIAALATTMPCKAALATLIDDGTLGAALYSVALLVRLLNDLGSGLLAMSPQQRRTLLQRLILRLAANQETPQTLVQFLASLGARFSVMNRIHKDATLAEVNISFYGIGHLEATTASLEHFVQNLALCTETYTMHRERLRGSLEKISARLHDPRISQLLDRFVSFHEQLYSQPYNTAVGEYAI